MAMILDSTTIVGTEIDDGIGTLQVSGIVTVTTPPLDDNSTKLANYEFVQNAMPSGITISTEAPINPDPNPEQTTWIQIDDNKMIVSLFEWNDITGWNLN